MMNKLLRRMRAARSAYRLFFKIFLWFWLTIWGVFLFVVISNHFTGLHEVKQPNMYATVMPILAAQAVHAYETGGQEEFARFSHEHVDDKERTLYLLDGFDQDVLHRQISDNGIRTARAVKSGQLLMLRESIAAYRFTSSSGRPYVLLLRMSNFNEAKTVLLSRGIPVLLSLLVMVTCLCLWLAYHIVSPIHAIQSAARRVTGGDLSARASPKILKRHDELAELATDFNLMVQKIEILLHSHKSLLAAVSHEVRSPLTRLTLSITLLRKERHPTAEDLLVRMDRDIGVLDNLMGQLLTLSRFEVGISGTRREEVNLRQLVEEVGANGAFEGANDDKSVDVKIKDEAILPAGDSYALRSACENVVRNAVRFTQPGTTVGIELFVEHGSIMNFAIISVNDRGPGVPETMLDDIFKPFVRVENDMMLANNNGLGLAIAAGAIHLHSGSIVASNRRDGGLEVVIRLPLQSIKEKDLR